MSPVHTLSSRTADSNQKRVRAWQACSRPVQIGISGNGSYLRLNPKSQINVAMATSWTADRHNIQQGRQGLGRAGQGRAGQAKAGQCSV